MHAAHQGKLLIRFTGLFNGNGHANDYFSHRLHSHWPYPRTSGVVLSTDTRWPITLNQNKMKERRMDDFHGHNTFVQPRWRPRHTGKPLTWFAGRNGRSKSPGFNLPSARSLKPKHIEGVTRQQAEDFIAIVRTDARRDRLGLPG